MKRLQRGAALLLAMIVVTLVATLAAGMVWQQSRSVAIEAAERTQTQAEWVLIGALDWARLILREDARSGRPTAIGEPWSMPLEEARLSSFLAADKDNNADSGPEVFISGRIVDAQSRYNLRNLVDAEGKVVPAELKAFERLCEAAGLPSDTPTRLAEQLRLAWAPNADENPEAAIAPRRVEELVWLGLDAATVGRLEPYVSLLPVRTPVNVNTAGREVLLASIEGLDLASAERLVQVRQRNPFKSIQDVRKELPEGSKVEEARVAVRSDFFDVYGRLRLEERVVEQRSLVQRRGERGAEVVTLQRDRRSTQFAAR